MIILQWVRFGFAALLLLGGMITLLATVVGVFRFPYVLNRIHFAAKCDTFGVLLTLSSLIVMIGWDFASLKLLLIIIFIWVTNPVANHLIAQVEVSTNTKITKECEVTPNDAAD